MPHLPRAAVAVLACFAVASLVGCGGAQGETPQAESPQDLISAWSAIACSGAAVESRPAEDNAIAVAVCDQPGVGGAAARQAFMVYESEAALATKIAGLDCSYPSFRVTGGEWWYASSSDPKVATALQEVIGGKLACM